VARTSYRFSPLTGTLLRSIPVKNPISVAGAARRRSGVGTLREPHLVIVFDKNGRDVREFGDPEPLAEREELNRYLNIGQLATDAQGHLYYAFAYLPEPTVRQYDRLGYAGQGIQYTALDAMPAAQAARKEIVAPGEQRPAAFVQAHSYRGGRRPDKWGSVDRALQTHCCISTRKATGARPTDLHAARARLEANTISRGERPLLIGSDRLASTNSNADKKNLK